MNHVKTVLENFGQHTRQSDDELLDTSKIAQKYVAVHIGELAYNRVSNDYSAMDLRTHNPPLKMYRVQGKIDVPTFMSVMKHASLPTESLPMFHMFQQEFFPRDKDQEKWQYLERPDQWKEVAAYVAMTMPTSPKLAAICDELNVDRQALKGFIGVNKDKSGLIYNEVGAILSGIDMQQQDNLFLGKPIPALRDNTSVQQLSSSSSPTASGLITLDKKGEQNNETDLSQLRTLMEPYRIRAGLNKTFNTEKLAKQIMISALNVPTKSVPASILSRHQKSVAPLVNDEERQLASTLVDAFQTEPDFDPNKSSRCQAMSKATLNNMWEPRTLLKHVLHAPQHVSNGRHLEMYTKSGVDGTHDEELARAIEKL